MKYLDSHKPENQEKVNGVIVNPNLRQGFDSTAHEDRPYGEWEDWNGVPYVVGDGDRWQVRCLDGGAWDRSTLLGFHKSMTEAINQVT